MNTPRVIQTSSVKSVGGQVQINSIDNAVIHSNATNVYQATSKRYCHTAKVLGCVTNRHSITHSMHLAQQPALIQSDAELLQPRKGKVISYLTVPIQKSFLSFTCTSDSWCLQWQSEESESMRNNF